MKKLYILFFLLASVAHASSVIIVGAPVNVQGTDSSAINGDGAGNLKMNLQTSVPSGSNVIGKVGIDQTTPGTTNGIQVNAALPAGTNLLGKMGIDQTTPGTTNGVQINAALPAGGNTIGNVGLTSSFFGSAGSAAANVLTVQGNASSTPIPVTVSGGTASSRSDTFTTAVAGTTVDVHTAPVKYFSMQVTQTGTVTSWTVNLECSLDNSNFTTMLSHTNSSPGTGQIVFGGTTAFPCLYFRSKVSALTLGAGTNIIAVIVGM